MMRPSLPLALFFTLSLTACTPSREVADTKLGAACKDSLIATFQDEKERLEVQEITYDFKKAYDGARLRQVTVHGQYFYGDSEPDNKAYTCNYSEEWTLFSYLPEFYNLQRDTVKVGNFGGVITGDTTLLLKITEITHKNLD
jgi:hypothetical protein